MTEEERALSQVAKELRAAEVAAQTERRILREWSALGRDPVYASDGIPLSPSLVRLIRESQGHSHG